MGYGYRPIISKIRVLNPNANSTNSRNVNYLYYIATREGTDLTAIKPSFLTTKYITEYNLDLNEKGEELFTKRSDDDSYLKYISHRPRSHGLFGNIDTEDFEEVSKRLKEVSKNKRIIYRGVISLSELDAHALGFLDNTKWDCYLREVLPDIAKELGVSQNNFTWVAAYHAEPTHPHVHYMLWDNRDVIKSPFIRISKQQKCRKICQDAMFTEENENIIRELTKAEREELYSIKNDARKNLTNCFHELFHPQEIDGEFREVLPGKLTETEHKEFKKLALSAIEKLPGKGSLKYEYMPPDCKKELNNISKFFYQQKEIQKQYVAYMDSVRKIQKITGKTKNEIHGAIRREENDLLNRTGNIILKGLFHMKNELDDLVKSASIPPQVTEVITEDTLNLWPEHQEILPPICEIAPKNTLEEESKVFSEIDNLVSENVLEEEWRELSELDNLMSENVLEEEWKEFSALDNVEPIRTDGMGSVKKNSGTKNKETKNLETKIALQNAKDTIQVNKYTYALVREILFSLCQQNNKAKMILNEADFQVKSKETQKEQQIHHN